MRTIAIVNQKGGCGKTTTAINLAALYAKRGLRTLLVDMDPQSHCAAGLGVPEKRIEYSIGDALIAAPTRPFDPSTLVWEVARNLHLAPSTMKLSALEAPGGGLHQLPDKDRRLENLLARFADRYDRCLIDCPPTIGLLTFNALRAAREALIPVETGFFSLRGAEKQWTTIQRMITHIGRPIACHLLPTLHNPQSQLACNILAALRRQFAGQILPVVIHEDEALREAASLGQPVFEYAPDSTARGDFERLADWLEEHASRPVVEIEVLAPDQILETADRHKVGPVPRAYPAGGSRAAELVRRVRDLKPEAPQTEQSHSTPCTEADHISAMNTATLDPTDAHLISLAEPESHSVESAAEPDELQALLAKPAAPNTAAAPQLPESPQVVLQLEDELGIAATSTNDHVQQHLYGVRQTTQGTLFIQPLHLARTVAIAGDFNRWSTTSHTLRINEAAGVFELLVPLPSGSHQYRIVADGEWIPDQFNPHQRVNCYGEPNSVVVVP